MIQRYSNLIPATLDRQQLVRNLVRQWLIFGAIGGLIGLAVNLLMQTETARLKRETARVAGRNQVTENFRKETKALTGRCTQLEDEWAAYGGLTNADIYDALLRMIEAEIKPLQGRVALDSVTIRQIAEPSSQSIRTSRIVVDISGQAKDDDALGQLLGQLRERPFLESVELTATQSGLRVEQSSRTFQMQGLILLDETRQLSPGEDS